MNYNTRSRKQNRIQDPNQILYVRGILEAAIAQCQQAQMYSPEVYLGTAQRIADLNSLNDATKPRVSFNLKQQTIRGQDVPITELSATIGDKTSSSYFLLKDSCPAGSKPSQEQLTYLRPDIVSSRIAASLGISQPVQVMPNVPATNNLAIPTQSTQVTQPINSAVSPYQVNPNASKAAAFVQDMRESQVINNGVPPQAQVNPNPYQPQTQPQAPVTPQAQVPVSPQAQVNPTNSIAEQLSALATEGVPLTPPQAPVPPTQVNPNPYQVPGAAVPPQPIHDPQQAKTNKRIAQNAAEIGITAQNTGQAVRRMSQGTLNPIQLHGNTLEIIGKFLMGVSSGINQARLVKIMEQIKKIESEKELIDQLRRQTGQDLVDLGQKSARPPQEQVSESSDRSSIPRVKTNPAPHVKPDVEIDRDKSPVESEVEPTAVDKLLKSKIPIEDKLEAIEKTLDKMLDELTATRKALEAIQSSIESEQQQQEGKVVETEVNTEVSAVANQPEAEVPVRTEIDTEIVAEAKSPTEAKQEVEVPEIAVDSTPEELNPNIDWELVNTIYSYEGDLDSLNKHLQSANLQIDIAEDGSSLTIKELNRGVANPILTAEAKGEGWNIQSQVSDSVKLDILNSFVEAEDAALADIERIQANSQAPTPVKEELSLEMG